MTPPPTDTPASAPFPYEPVPPLLLAWAKQTFDMEEHLRGLEEIKAGGGCSLDSFIAELEARAGVS